MKTLRRIILSLTLIGLVWPAFSQLRLPAIFSDHMVLQQQSDVPIWGWAAPNSEVMVKTSFRNYHYQFESDDLGEWRGNIYIPEAGEKFTIRISNGDDEIHLKNCIAGEVWLCSGQSNMEMPMKGWTNQPISESEKYIQSADYPNIRLFTVKRKISSLPLDDCEGEWAAATPETVAPFSATGYFFGLKLYQELGIPIGLILSSWGGTPAEAWTSGEFIKNIPEIGGKGDFDPVKYRENKLKRFERQQNQWIYDMGFSTPDKSPDWVQPDFDDSDWNTIRVPANWADTDMGAYQGVLELRYEVKVPRSWRKKATMLDLGPIDEIDVVWVNGVEVGRHLNIFDWATFRSYEVPAGVLKKGVNTIAVLVGNTSGLGGINGEADKMKLYPVGKKTKWQALAGDWRYSKGMTFDKVVAMPNCVNCSEPQTPTVLYNGMIAPIIPFKIAGAIWYQGESNRSDGKQYSRIFPNMIKNWRYDWNQGAFPFYFVQIAPYTYRDEYSTGQLKEAQMHAMHVPNTGMVVTSDIGSLTTIHPPDKKSVGFRLAKWALAHDYGFDVPYSGPIFKAYKIEDDQIRIFFDYAENGLKQYGDLLTHFTIAGADKNFIPAQAEIEGNTILVSAEGLKNPVAVRFAWGHTDEPNLFNTDGLPASPFRTDNWKE